MKDVPHHMAKFLEGFAKEETPKSDESLKEMNREKPKKQVKKQKKVKVRKERALHIPKHDTPDEKNKKMNKRVPVRKERSHKTII